MCREVGRGTPKKGDVAFFGGRCRGRLVRLSGGSGGRPSPLPRRGELRRRHAVNLAEELREVSHILVADSIGDFLYLQVALSQKLRGALEPKRLDEAGRREVDGCFQPPLELPRTEADFIRKPLDAEIRVAEMGRRGPPQAIQEFGFSGWNRGDGRRQPLREAPLRAQHPADLDEVFRYEEQLVAGERLREVRVGAGGKPRAAGVFLGERR